MVFSDKRNSVFTHTLIYSFGNLITRGLSFILLPIYSHYITTNDFGIYSFIISIVTIISTILNLGFPSIFVKNLSESYSETDKQKIFSNIITFSLVTTIPAFILISLFSNQILLLISGNSKFVGEFIVGLFSILIFNYSYYFSAFYVAIENSKKYLTITSVSAFLNFILNILFVAILKLGVYGIFISQIFSSLVLIALSGEIIKGYFRFLLDLKFVKNLIAVSFPLLLSGFFTILVEVMDRIFIIRLLSEQDAGIYSFGYRIAMIYNLFIISFKSAWIPHYMRIRNLSSSEIEVHLGRIFTKLVFISSFIILCITLFIDDLFNFQINGFSIFDLNYSTSQSVIIYILIGYFFSLLMGFYSLAPYLTNQTKHFFFSDFLAFVVNLVLNLLLIPLLQIVGAAIATLFAFMVSAVYLYFYSVKRVRVKYELSKVLSIAAISFLIYLISINKNYLIVDVLLIILLIGIGSFLKIINKNLISFRIF